MVSGNSTPSPSSTVAFNRYYYGLLGVLLLTDVHSHIASYLQPEQ